MTRLSDRQSREFNQKILFLLIILILFVVFVYTVGLKLLFNTSIFVSRLLVSGNNQQNQEKTEDSKDFIGSVNVVDIPIATNSAEIIVSGNLLNIDALEIYLNGQKTKAIDTAKRDTFTETIGGLQKGDNQIYFLGKNGELKKQKMTQNYTVTYKSEKPKLEIKEPTDGSKISKTEVKITGSTDKLITVRINNFPVVVDALGNFEKTIKLQEGENKIIIKAADDAGNFEEKTLTVTYQKEE